MEWLFKPKVQVGLSINLAFVMFTLVSSLARPHAQVTRALVGERQYLTDAAEPRVSYAATVDDNKFRYVQLPPRLGPSQATSYRDQQSGQISVYATKELTLVNKGGRTLKLWPAFYVNAPSIVPPRKVLLRFTSTSPGPAYRDECELEIWGDTGSYFSAALPVSHDRDLKGGAQAAVARMAQDIPYPFFLKLVTSRRVTLKVDGEEIILNDEQLGALRDMQRCIQDGVCG